MKGTNNDYFYKNLFSKNCPKLVQGREYAKIFNAFFLKKDNIFLKIIKNRL